MYLHAISILSGTRVLVVWLCGTTVAHSVPGYTSFLVVWYDCSSQCIPGYTICLGILVIWLSGTTVAHIIGRMYDRFYQGFMKK